MRRLALRGVDVPDLPHVVSVARRLLSPVGDRWLHAQVVGSRAVELSDAVPQSDRQLLVAAAWWHDIGYAPECRQTGFHPLDGARWLHFQGYPLRLCALVAHHSAARFEAAERGLSTELTTWPNEESAVTDALWAADMTTGPTGQRYTYDQRLAEILSRYEPESIVYRAMTKAGPTLATAIDRTALRRPATRVRSALHARAEHAESDRRCDPFFVQPRSATL